MEKTYIIRDALNSAMSETHLKLNDVANASGIARAELLAMKLGRRAATKKEIEQLEEVGLHIFSYAVPMNEKKQPANSWLYVALIKTIEKICSILFNSKHDSKTR